MTFFTLLWILFYFQEVSVLLTSSHVHIQECPTVVDVVFMVDYSNTISRREAQDTKLFIKSVVLHPNPSKEDPSVAVPAAKRLKDNGIIVISFLGLGTDKDGSNINKNQLKYVASSQSHVVVTSYPSDDSQTNELISLICSVDRKPEVFISRSEEMTALEGHLIQTFEAWNDFSCAFNCLHTKNCYSFNFKKRENVCELNHSNKLASPGDLIVDMDSVYHELPFSNKERK